MSEVIWIIAGLLGIVGTVRDELANRRLNYYMPQLRAMAAKLMSDQVELNRLIEANNNKRNDIANAILYSSPVSETFRKLKAEIARRNQNSEKYAEALAQNQKAQSDINTAAESLREQLTDNPFKSESKMQEHLNNQIYVNPKNSTEVRT